MQPNKVIEAWRKDSRATETNPLLSEPFFRKKVYEILHPQPTIQDRTLLLRLLALEMDYRRDETNSGDEFENLYWCGLLLHRLGIAEDSLPMWQAKQVNFDTACGFDIQFLVGAGLDETLAFLSGSDDPEAQKAHDYILECRAAGDFEDLGYWLDGRLAYFN